jgi:hypothetical protein
VDVVIKLLLHMCDTGASFLCVHRSHTPLAKIGGTKANLSVKKVLSTKDDL